MKKKAKTKQTIVKSWRLWNKIPNKPADANCVAEAGDICMKINQVWFLCQRKDCVNNIVCREDTEAIFPQSGPCLISLTGLELYTE